MATDNIQMTLNVTLSAPVLARHAFSYIADVLRARDYRVAMVDGFPQAELYGRNHRVIGTVTSKTPASYFNPDETRTDRIYADISQCPSILETWSEDEATDDLNGLYRRFSISGPVNNSDAFGVIKKHTNIAVW